MYRRADTYTTFWRELRKTSDQSDPDLLRLFTFGQRRRFSGSDTLTTTGVFKRRVESAWEHTGGRTWRKWKSLVFVHRTSTLSSTLTTKSSRISLSFQTHHRQWLLQHTHSLTGNSLDIIRLNSCMCSFPRVFNMELVGTAPENLSSNWTEHLHHTYGSSVQGNVQSPVHVFTKLQVFRLREVYYGDVGRTCQLQNLLTVRWQS